MYDRGSALRNPISSPNIKTRKLSGNITRIES